MEDRVEVNLGEKAQIACRFTTEEGIGGTTIQWFYVRFTSQRPSHTLSIHLTGVVSSDR